MRSYGDPCGIARALDLVGERWALLVARELLLGPKRFTDLRAGLPHVGPDMLSQRLRELEHAGVVQRGKLPPPAGARVYELTDWGRRLEPVVLALKTLFEPARVEGLLGRTFELRLGEETFSLRVGERELEAVRGSAGEATATIATEAGTLQRILWHGRSPRSGGLEIAGDRRAAERFLRLFPLRSRTSPAGQ